MRDEQIKSDRLRVIGELAAGIAHEFNNLLQAILGNIDLALLISKDGRVNRYLLNAAVSVGKSRELANKLIIFSKGGRPNKKIMPLSPWIRDIVFFYSSIYRFKFSFNIPSDISLVKIDPDLLRQVFVNLIENSYEAKPEDLEISISAKVEFLDRSNPYSLREGKYVKISFRDNGPGIPKENLHKVFDPFFTTKEFGRGLGLSIVHVIVKKHEGAIDVESEFGKGTTFHIFLPAVDA